MNSPYYLKEQRLLPKRKSPVKAWFRLFVLLSLSLNVYFIFFQSDPPELAQVQEQAEEITLEADVAANSEPVIPETVVEINDFQELEQPLPPQPQITRVAFSPPKEINGQEALGLQFKIRNSLTFSICNEMTREEGCEQMSAYMSRLLSWFFDINKDMRNGDPVRLVFQKTDDDSRFQVLKLVYESQYFKKVFEANYFTRGDSGLGSYYDAEGVEIAKRIVDRFAPVRDYHEITSLPGDYRAGPVGHEGTDFKTAVGTPVYASFEGRVTRINWNVRANGYCVELDHPAEGVKTLYLHLSDVLVKPNQFVKQGEKIAETGNTGRTFAPHLHYEIKSRDSRRIVYNPFNFKHMKSYYGKVSAGELGKFKTTVRLYDSILQNG